MKSSAKHPDDYLNSLPADRKEAIVEMRRVIRKNLPKGFEETINYGMLGYVVPHSIYPKGYHCNPKQPLPFLSVASQKNYISFYHMGLYEGGLLDWFNKEWKKVSEKKADMGKCCIRFRKPEDIPFNLLGELVSKMTPEDWIKYYESTIGRTDGRKSK